MQTSVNFSKRMDHEYGQTAAVLALWSCSLVNYFPDIQGHS